MEQLSIFSATLGLAPPWQVTSVVFGKQSNRLDIWVEYLAGCNLTCPACGALAPAPGAGLELETWYHADFFRYNAYLHARFPRVICSCGTLSLERPWCRAGSKFRRVLDAPAEQLPMHDFL